MEHSDAPEENPTTGTAYRETPWPYGWPIHRGRLYASAAVVDVEDKPTTQAVFGSFAKFFLQKESCMYNILNEIYL